MPEKAASITAMSFTHFFLAFLLIITQRSQASFPFATYFDHPVIGLHELPHPYPYVAAVAEPAPFVHAAMPAPALHYGFPYGPIGYHSNFYHPRMALHNVAKAFSREKGHLSATSIISPWTASVQKI